MSLDARPTVAEPDDDPYLWLEDIEGERALAWVAAENDRTLKTFGGAAVRRRPRHPGGDPRPARQAPAGRAARTVALQFLARRQEPARPVAAHHARELSPRPAGVGDPARCRRPGRGRRRGLDLGRCGDAARHARPRDPASLARRQRRRGVARVRSREPHLREGRLRAAGGQGLGELARSRHAAAQQRLGRRRHDFGLCADGAPVAPRQRCGASAGPLRGAA